MQPTKFQCWCEAVIEAGWLAALVLTPLFFNLYSSQVIEPDKTVLVRLIAAIMLVVWLVKGVASGKWWRPAGASRGPAAAQRRAATVKAAWWRPLWRIPLLFPVLLLVLAYLLSTWFSLAPSLSWWGSYERLQGTYTFLNYIIIFLLTAAHLRSPTQIRRLQHAIIVTSLPIALYAIIQHYGVDPLPWEGNVTVRSTANAGNAIFLSAYLLMAIFLTVERIVSSFAYLLRPTRQTAAARRRTRPQP